MRYRDMEKRAGLAIGSVVMVIRSWLAVVGKAKGYG